MTAIVNNDRQSLEALDRNGNDRAVQTDRGVIYGAC
jgi:hypothetical protein